MNLSHTKSVVVRTCLLAVLACTILLGCLPAKSADKPGWKSGPSPRISPLDLEARAKALVAGALRLTAIDAYQSGAYDVALDALLKFRELGGRSADDDKLALLYLKVGNYKEAILLYERMLAADYDGQRQYRVSPAIWCNYGEALISVGRKDEALEAFKNATQGIAPPEGAKDEVGHRAFAHFMAGNGYQAFGTMQEQLHHYKIAVELMPNWDEARRRLDRQVDAIRSSEEVTEARQKALATPPQIQ